MSNGILLIVSIVMYIAISAGRYCDGSKPIMNLLRWVIIGLTVSWLIVGSSYVV